MSRRRRHRLSRLLHAAAYGYATRNWDTLTRAAVERLGLTLAEGGYRGLAVMSSWRPGRSAADDDQARQRLRQQAASLGYGHLELLSFARREDGSIRDAPVFVIPRMTREHALRLAGGHTQAIVLIAGPDGGGKTDQVDVAAGTVRAVWPRLNVRAMRAYLACLHELRATGPPGSREPGTTPGDPAPPVWLHYHACSIGENRALDTTIRRIQVRLAEPPITGSRAAFVHEKFL